MNTQTTLRNAVVTSAILLTLLASAGWADDALDEALDQVGLRRGDLGWSPPGWWLGYPGDIPYKLRHFDGLMRQPLATVSYTRSLAGAVRTYLDPAKLNDKPDRAHAGGLYRLACAVGVNPRFGGHRGYSANTSAADTPLDEAILAVHRAAGRPTTFVTFGEASPYPKYAEDLAKRVKAIPAVAQPILGRLVLNVVEAQRWADLAFRNVPGNQRIAVSRRMNLGEEQVDALDYEPAVDDVARSWDEASLWYAGLKSVQALDEARRSLQTLAAEAPPFAFDWETPYGWIRIRGAGHDLVDATDAWLIVDLGGNDRYTGPAGASAADRAIGLLLDLGGDDEYVSSGPSQGAGICGVGVLLDVAGADRYDADRLAQGVGQFGFGACIDLEGDDRYFAGYSGQGCGYFGVGLLIDAGGADAYRLYCDGQGFGGVAGVGVLADYSGDDAYEAVRESDITGRPSYHSPDMGISVSNAQGCASGRRGDGGDGHCWAGGLGALIDLCGDDTYLAGNWSMGTGYWFGTGLLYDGGGSDIYRGAVWTQGSGAHFCIGALLDEGGNDLHVSEENSVNGLGFGHDFAVALLVNLGGNDLYTIDKSGLGYSINRSVAMLLDVGGDDTYTSSADNRPGTALFDERLRDRSGSTTYFADSTSVGLFLDVGGRDTYDSATTAKNDSTWLDAPDADNWAVRNYAVGVDRAEGDVNLAPLPQKVPSLGASRRMER